MSVEQFETDAIELLGESGPNLLGESLRVINASADIQGAIKKVVAAIERYKSDREGLTLEARAGEMRDIRELAWALSRRVYHATRPVSDVLAPALKKTSAGDKDGFADLLGEVAGVCLVEARRLNKEMPIGRPKAGAHLRKLIFELSEIFVVATNRPMKIGNNSTKPSGGQGWWPANKDNAARRFVEVALFEGLGETLAPAQMRTTLLAAREHLATRES